MGKSKFLNGLMDAAVIGAQTAMSPLTVPVQAVTGKSPADILGYNYKTNIGESYDNISSKVVSSAAPMAANMVVPGSGLAVTGMQKAYSNFENKKLMQDQQPIMYRKGGIVTHDLINIEKGELEVNPTTGEVVREFDSAPKHPKEGINEKGNRYVKKGHAIIPANKREEYLSAGITKRMDIIDSLPKYLNNGKAENGFVPDVPDASVDLEMPISRIGGGLDGEELGLGIQDPGNDFKYESPQQQQQQQPGKYAKYAAIGMAAPTLGLGIWQTYQANKGLKALAKQPSPNFGTPAEMQILKDNFAGARDRAKFGFNQAEANAFHNNLNTANNTRLRNGIDMGGGSMASAINSSIQSQTTKSYLDFAAQDAKLKEQKQQYADTQGARVASAFTEQGNRNQSKLIQDRRDRERALGAGLKTGTQNIVNSSSQAAMMAMGGSGGSGGMNLSNLAALAQFIK